MIRVVESLKMCRVHEICNHFLNIEQVIQLCFIILILFYLDL